jgi:hypothetical protein
VSAITRVPLRRFLRASRSWLALGLWALIAIGPALLERAHATGHGADHALLGFYATLSLPFVAFTTLSAILGREGLGRAGIVLANFGAPPGRVALSAVTVAITASAVLGGALGALVAAVAHGPLDPPIVADALRSFAAGALGGAAYAALFALGASFGARGFGRSVLLVLDWVLGSDDTASALFTPRAHVRGLLGGEAPLDLSPRASYVALALMVVVFTGLAVTRASRARWSPSRVR